MKDIIKESIEESIKVKRKLLEQCTNSIIETAITLIECLKEGKKILICGNGGSAADSQHLAAELVIRYRSSVNRPSIPAIALTVDPSISSAGGNDIGFDNVFSRCVESYGQKGDTLIGISTSGNSENVYRAIKTAKEKELRTIGLLGSNGGKIAEICEKSVIVPSNITARIQESHIVVAHIWCEIIEEVLYKDFFKK